MRNLILRRESSFVASLIEVNVYAKDLAGDVFIDRLPCRKVGTIKNGEVKTFSIPEEETMIFVLATEPNDHTAYPFHTVAAGSQDVLLSAKMKLRKNHPNEKFTVCFDPNHRFDPKKCQSRRDFKRWLVRMLLIVLCTGAIRSCLAQEASPRTFTKEGMSITLTASFEEKTKEGFTALYSSDKVSVFIDKILPGEQDLTAEQYAKNWLLANKLFCVIKQCDNGSVRFQFDETQENGDNLRFTFYVYQTNDAIWVVQFVTSTEDAPELEEKIEAWADSVQFAE